MPYPDGAVFGEIGDKLSIAQGTQTTGSYLVVNRLFMSEFFETFPCRHIPYMDGMAVCAREGGELSVPEINDGADAIQAAVHEFGVLPGLRIPYLDLVVGGEELVITKGTQGIHLNVSGSFRVNQGSETLSRLDIPYLGFLIATGDEPVIPKEAHTGHMVTVSVLAAQGFEALSRLDIPYLDGVITGAGGKPVIAKGAHTVHPVTVSVRAAQGY